MASVAPLALSIAGGYLTGGLWWGYAAGGILGNLLFPQKVDIGGRKFDRIQVSTANKGAPLPIVYGRTRITGNLIWAGEFDKEESGAKGKGGKGGKGQQGAALTYTATLALALCEGVIDNYLKLYVGGEPRTLVDFYAGSYPEESVMYTLYYGTAGQAPDPNINLAQGQYALAYPHTAYVILKHFDLGSSASVPNITFEVQRTNLADNTSLPAGLLALNIIKNADNDLNPVTIITDLLTHTRYGLGIPADEIDWASFIACAQEVAANGLFISPAFETNRDASSMIEEMMTCIDALLVYYQGQFHLRLRRAGDAPTTTIGWTNVSGTMSNDWFDGARGSQKPIIEMVGFPNRLLAVYTHSNRIWYRTSTDSGATWSAGAMVDNDAIFGALPAPYVGTANQQWPCLCTTPNGTFHIVFTSNSTLTPGERQIWYAWWNWGDPAWQPSIRVSDGLITGGGTQTDARIVGESTNDVHIVWSGISAYGRFMIWHRQRTLGAWVAPYNLLSFEYDWEQTVYHNYHLAVFMTPADTMHVVWCQAQLLPFIPVEGDDWREWWWREKGSNRGGVGGIHWPDIELQYAYLSDPLFPENYYDYIKTEYPAFRLVTRTRSAAGVWDPPLPLDVGHDSAPTVLKFVGTKYDPCFPYVCPGVVVTAGGNRIITYQHRTYETPFSQIWIYGQYGTHSWNGERISTAEGQQYDWNCEPWLTTNDQNDLLIYWAGYWPPNEPGQNWPRTSWFRKFDLSIDAWGDPTQVVVPGGVTVVYNQWYTKSLAPSQSEPGLIGIWIPGQILTTHNERCWYSYGYIMSPIICQGIL